MKEKERLLSALRCQNHGRPPVWLMRQAGRYMPEYRALRQRYSLLEMFHDPSLIEEVTQLPIDLLGVDAAILFSDILLTVEALGKTLHFEKGAGPIVTPALRTPADVLALPEPDIARGHRGVFDGIRALRRHLKVPLIGFAGAPFTIAAYMIEGGSSKDWKRTRLFSWEHPSSFQDLLRKISDAVIQSLQQQINAGVQAVQLFDSWAQILSHSDFIRLCLPTYRRILEALQASNVPVILFARGTAAYIQEMAALQPAALSVDWPCNLRQIRAHHPIPLALQGNLDPHLLYAPEPVIKQRVQEILETMDSDPGYIFNLGHGIFPDVPVSAVRTVVETVKSYEPKTQKTTLCH